MYIVLFLKRIFNCLLSIVTAAAWLFGTETDIVKPVEDFHVTSYIIADRIQNKADLYTEDFDIITDVIMFGCAAFNEKGEVVLQTQVLETALENLREVIGERDVAITLNLLGPSFVSNQISWEDDMEQQSIVHNKAFSSGVLEENIKKVVEHYDFDGVHFDYEYPIKLSHWNKFSSFLISLDKVMPDRIIGIAICEWNAYMTTYALEAVDYFEMMMYDIYDEEGRHSTYERATELIHEATLSGVPREKMHFGLPFYARPTDHDAYWYDYRGYHDKLDENNFYYDEDLQKSFWFNTPEVIFDKTAYAHDNGFGGVMIWHYTCDLPSTDPYSLLAAIGRAI